MISAASRLSMQPMERPGETLSGGSKGLHLDWYAKSRHGKLSQPFRSQMYGLWGCGTPLARTPLTSLENWGHGNAIEQMTRIIRLTRPEVILACIPLNIAGEHGDHQAAGIVATHAMDIASDPSEF